MQTLRKKTNGVEIHTQEKVQFPSADKIHAALKADSNEQAFKNAMKLLDEPMQYYFQTVNLIALDANHPFFAFLKFYYDNHDSSLVQARIDKKRLLLGVDLFGFIRNLRPERMVGEDKEITLSHVKGWLKKGAKIDLRDIEVLPHSWRGGNYQEFFNLPHVEEIFKLIIKHCIFNYWAHPNPGANIYELVVKYNKPELLRILLTLNPHPEIGVLDAPLVIAWHNMLYDCLELLIGYLGKKELQNRQYPFTINPLQAALEQKKLPSTKLIHFLSKLHARDVGIDVKGIFQDAYHYADKKLSWGKLRSDAMKLLNPENLSKFVHYSEDDLNQSVVHGISFRK